MGAIAEGYRKIICVGGDGTLHQVVNAIMLQQKCPSTDVAVGMISVGTGNDWVRHHGIPTNYEKAIQVILKNNTKLQDVGKLVHNQQQEIEYFMNFVGIGYDAYVVEHTANLKKFGQAAYFLGLAQCLFKYDAQHLTIEVDGKKLFDEKVFMMIAGLGKYAGGGMKFSPDATTDDGWLDLTVGTDLSKTDIMMMLNKFYSGTYILHEKVISLKAKNIKVTPHSDIVKAESDGELIGNGPFEISLLEKAFKFYAP
jgi:diacylglycerol kinase (ATP)